MGFNVRQVIVPGGAGGGNGSINFSGGTTSGNLSNLVFSNSNGVSFGLNGSTITASITPAGGAQTAISGVIVSDATYTSGTISFSNQANITIGSSVNGATQYIRLSGNPPQTNQSAIKGFGVSNTGATAGNTGISTGVDWVLAGSNLLTLSQSTAVGGPNTVWVQHPAWLTTAMASNRGSDFVAATAAFNGTNASGTIASNAISVSVAAQSNQTVGLYASSNTYLTSSGTVDARSLSFRGDKSITVGVSAGEVLFSVGAYLTTAMLSNAVTISNIKVSAGTSSTNLSAVTFSDGNGVSFGLNGSVITASVAAAGGAQTGISGIIVSDATYTSGTVSFSNQNGVTIGSSTNGATQYIRLSVATNYQSQGAYLTTAALSGDTTKYLENWKLTGNTAGTTSSAQGTDLWLAGGNGVTLSGNSNTITISVATNYQSQGAYLTTAALSGDTTKYVQNWKLTGNTSGTTSSAQGTDLWFSGGNSITVSGSSNTIVFSVGNYLTTAMASNRGSDFVAATAGFNGTNASGTLASNSWSISVAAQSNQTLGLYAVSNTEGASSSSTFDARTISFQGKGAVSIGFSNGSIVFDAPSAAAGNVTFSAGANSAGLASVVFSNSNGVSFGLNGSTITASVAAGGGGGIGGGVSTGGNTVGSTGTVTTGNIVFVGSGVISLSQSTGAAGSNATISILAPATSSLLGTSGISLSTNGSTISIMELALTAFEPLPLLNVLSTTWAPTSSSWYFQPVFFPAPVSGGRINQIVAHGSTLSVLPLSSASFQTGSTGTGSSNFTYARKAALYSLGAGTNSTRLESLWSNQWSLSIDQLIKVASAAGPNMTVSAGATISYLVSIDSVGGTTTSTVGHSSTVAAAASSISTSQLSSINTSERNILSSQLMIPIPFNTTINPGNYWLALMWITGSTTAGTGNLTSTAGQVLSIVNQYGFLGNTNTNARIWGQTAASSGSVPYMGVGVYSAGSVSPPATIAFSDLRTYASMQLPYWNLQNSTI